VQQQSVVGMDETSFVQGNQDGHNPQQQGWLGDGDPVGELLSRLAQPFSSYCSSVGPGFKEFSPVTVIVLTTG